MHLCHHFQGLPFASGLIEAQRSVEAQLCSSSFKIYSPVRLVDFAVGNKLTVFTTSPFLFLRGTYHGRS